MSLNDPQLVAEEYADERGLLGRRAAYEYADGSDAHEVLFEAVREAAPARVREVGWINFPDGDAVARYVDSSRTLWSRGLPAGGVEALRVRREPIVYVAEKAA